MALPAEAMRNVPTIEEFWASFTKSQEEAAKRQEEWEKRQEKQKEAWDRGMAELKAAQEKTERTVSRVGKQMGDLHHRFGELAEHLVAPGIIKRFNEVGYHFDAAVTKGLKILDGPSLKLRTEIDLLLENGEASIAVEVKSRPVVQDVAHHVRRLEILREYKDKQKDRRKVYGAIAGAVFPEEAMEAAIAEGLYVIVQSGDTMKIDNPEGFVPREW